MYRIMILYSKRVEAGLFYHTKNKLKASPRCGERFGEGFHIWLNYEPFSVYHYLNYPEN
jgi:hypothetical protein